MSQAKEEARKIIDGMPEHATWDDIMYQMYVRKKISTAAAAAEDGRVIPHDEVVKRFA